MNNENDQTAERFLVALEGWVQELMALSQLPLANPTKLNFEDYTKFRDKKEECLSFMIIIERRIGQGGGERKERLTEQFDRLVVAIWSILMQGSFGFLTVLCERAQLPIGTQHVFEQELKIIAQPTINNCTVLFIISIFKICWQNYKYCLLFLKNK